MGQGKGHRLNLHPARKSVAEQWLDLYIFESIEEVQQITAEWLWPYNQERPNMGNGGMTPAQKLKVAA
jgi:putative transposase